MALLIKEMPAAFKRATSKAIRRFLKRKKDVLKVCADFSRALINDSRGANKKTGMSISRPQN
jgi:hypothetical protein